MDLTSEPLTSREVAETEGISPQTVLNWAREFEEKQEKLRNIDEKPESFDINYDDE
jgi:transposase